ncbi:MAG TPA: ribbon-helix-helix protein, CopG family [Stellaceae bacterium]|jgi:predicted transcriptional regulator
MPDDSRLPSTHVTLRVPTDIVEKFDRLATAMERPRSWVLLRALRHYLEAEGVEVFEDLESIAQLDRGEYEPFENSLKEIEQIIKRAEKKHSSRK